MTDTTFKPEIPVVDIGGLADLAAPSARAAADALCRAYEAVGFAYITGHGVSPGLIARAFAASADFHPAPLAQKQSIAINPYHRGYIAIAPPPIVTPTAARLTKPNPSQSPTPL